MPAAVPDVDLEIAQQQAILGLLRQLRETSRETLLEVLYRDQWNRAAAIPVLWAMVAQRIVGADLTRPLTMKTPIWATNHV